MEEAQRLLEEWLSETTSRTMYHGNDLAERLLRLGELITDSDAQAMMLTWRDTVVGSEYYSQVAVQDRLLDLWGAVSTANARQSV